MDDVKTLGLNPYSIGIWSATIYKLLNDVTKEGLNPYSIGIWSATRVETGTRNKMHNVLILILLEYGLRLILLRQGERIKRLNPYSIGIWSATR